MKPSVHAVVSLAGGAALWAISGSWQAAAWSLVSGVLVDADHYLEYFKAGQRSLAPRKFFEFWRAFQEPKVYMALHIGELVPGLAVAAGLGIAPAITGGLAFGLFHHLLLDQFSNGVRMGGYFMITRVLVRFNSKRLFTCGQKESTPHR